MRSDPVGSIWRRWDLHFHTPSSFDYRGDPKASAADVVNALTQAGLSVVAVTDHHKIDIDRIAALQEAAGDRLTILPGIELRTELGGREKIHIIGVFSEDADLPDLWTKVQAALRITPRDVAQKGDDNIYVKFESACEAIHGLGGFVSVHAGTKSNSLERCLPSAVKLNQIIKTDLMRDHVDALELGSLADAAVYRDTIFPSVRRSFPMVLCSDSHNIANLDFRGGLWIKADPGFKGLLRTRHEPDTRIWLGSTPPLLERTRAAATKYLSGVSFRKVDLSVSATWFSDGVTLNPGLVAIIGNKGSGKSALADVIALTGNSGARDHFGFLNNRQFLRPRGGFGSAFEATLTWLSGSSRTCRLDAEGDSLSPELVKYLPQSYLEDLCAKVDDPGVSGFELELQQVVFSHVGAAQRLGKTSLGELIEYLTEETALTIQQLVRQVAEVNRSILELEQQATGEFRATLEGSLNQRLAESAAHDAARPAPVPEPKLDQATQQTLAAVSVAVAGLRNQLASIEQSMAEADVAKQDASEMVAAADRLRTRIANLKVEYNRFVEDSEGDLEVLGLTLGDVISLSTRDARLTEVEANAREELVRSASLLDETFDGSLAAERKAIRQALAQELPKLDEPGIRYQEYLTAEQQWAGDHALIVGAQDAPETILGLQKRLANLVELPPKIAALLERRDQLVTEIFRAKQTLVERHRLLYEPVQAFAARQSESSGEQGRFEFSARIMADGFAAGLFGYIHKGHRGSFYGDADGRAVAEKLVEVADFATPEGVLAFVHEIAGLLASDASTGRPIRLHDQLLQGVAPNQVLDYLYGLGYLRPRLELLWSGKTLPQLSPGERGTLLLLFYLLVDLSDCPLIMDQPEENLDNQTVYSVLVQAVRDAARRRQIILVTHNPNLAVVCDADQVVYAHRDPAQGNKVTYTTGALENPVITKLAEDVLEGTRPAFRKRDATYRLLDAR